MTNLLAVTAGIGALILCTQLTSAEQKIRREKYLDQIHTRFVECQNRIPPIDLASAHVVIGRRLRRCEIDLLALKDDSISKVHAILRLDEKGEWWIIPQLSCWHRGEDGRNHFYPQLTKVYVNNRPAPAKTGLRVRYGDMIRMGISQFRLEDTREE